jgi:hypothetical protein
MYDVFVIYSPFVTGEIWPHVSRTPQLQTPHTTARLS